MAIEKKDETSEAADTDDRTPVEPEFTPVAPKGLSEKESAQAKSQAADLVKQMDEASGSKALELRCRGRTGQEA